MGIHGHQSLLRWFQLLKFMAMSQSTKGTLDSAGTQTQRHTVERASSCADWVQSVDAASTKVSVSADFACSCMFVQGHVQKRCLLTKAALREPKPMDLWPPCIAPHWVNTTVQLNKKNNRGDFPLLLLKQLLVKMNQSLEQSIFVQVPSLPLTWHVTGGLFKMKLILQNYKYPPKFYLCGRRCPPSYKYSLSNALRRVPARFA